VPQTIFDIVTVDSWYDRDSNERREKSMRHRIVAYGHVGSMVSRTVRKGARVFVEGQIETRRWKDRNTTQKPVESWTVEIVVPSSGAGQVTVLDFHDGRPATVRPHGEPVSVTHENGIDDLADDAPQPLSIVRSHSKYGDDADDTDTAGLSRFLQADDSDRARRRAAGDDRRNAQ
jgi:single-strand DNA-binding protein